MSLNLVFLCVEAEEVKELVTKEVVEKCGKGVHMLDGGVVVSACTFLNPSQYACLYFSVRLSRREYSKCATRQAYILCKCVCVVVELLWQQHGTRVCCAICYVLSEEHTP